MRRNLVGKKLPQQPKIRWTDTVSLDAGSLTAEDLKAVRDANLDLPLSYDVHWSAIADGATNQFKKGDHMALSSAFISHRQNSMSTPATVDRSLTAGTMSFERSGHSYMPAAGGNTVADMNNSDAGSVGGTITNKAGGGVNVTTGAGDVTKVGIRVRVEDLPGGEVIYGSLTNYLGSNEYFRIRVKISELTLTQGQVVSFMMNNGGVEPFLEIDEPGVYTLYPRFIGNGDIELTLFIALNEPGYTSLGGCSMTIDYMHIDITSDISPPTERIDNATATSRDLLIGVRANGATAYTTAYDTSVTAGYQRSLYQDVLVGTAYNWGRSSDLRPHHEASYVASAGDIENDGWYALPRLAFLPIEDVWANLYANNPDIGADIDPTAEWFVGHDIPLHLPDWNTSTDLGLSNGDFYYCDAWMKDCYVQQQTSVAAVSASSWDGNWKRAHSGYNLFARNSTDDHVTWEYESFNNSDFPDEPNGFTLEARGIVLGAQQFLELCDDADGSQVHLGSTPAFRGSRGKIVTSGHDFSVLASGHEYATSYGADSDTNYTNAPAEFEWRMVTFIGESPQLVDITTSAIDTEGLNHWSHAGGVFGFAN